MNIRVYAMLTAVCITAATLASCGSGELPADTQAAATGSDAAPVETAYAGDSPDFEKCDYKGKKFLIYAPDWGLYKNYFFAAEQTGDVMNDAIYERARLTEDYLGVKLGRVNETDTIDDQFAKLNASVMAGDDAFQLILTHCITGVNKMLTGGLLCDWKKLEYVDLEKDYYNQNASEFLTLGGRQYYAVSDYMLPDPNCIMFNTKMIGDYKLADPYSLVAGGGWTVDKLVELSAAVSRDLNGDGTWDHNDQYGFSAPANWILASFYQSSDVFLTRPDGNGKLTVSFFGERTVKLIDKLDLLFNKTHDAFTYVAGTDEGKIASLKSGQVLFIPESFNAMHNYRDCEIEYGILPYPKFDEAQESYISNDWGGLMGIPVNAKDLDMIGKTCETLAYYSDTTTIPAYYDLVLGEKLSRDENSKKSLELIYGNVVYDPGIYFFGWGVMSQLFHSIKTNVVLGKNGDIASFYKARETAVQGEVDAFFDALPK